MSINFKRFRLGFASIVAAGSLAGILPASPASADLCVSTTSCIVNLTQGNSSSGFGAGNFGTVDLERTGSTVTVTIDLAPGFFIVKTGFPGVAGFADSLGGGLTIGNFSSPFYSGFLSHATNDLHFDGFGFSNDAVATTLPPNGNQATAVNVLSFDVSKAGLNDVEQLLNLFNPAGGDGPALFVVDAINRNTSGPGAGQTGLIAGTTTSTPRVPEPASLTLLGSGLIGMGFFAYRRRKDAA